MALHYHLHTTIIEDLLHGPAPKVAYMGQHLEIRDTFFPAEWFPQSAVQLTWPHEDTDWAPILEQVNDCYISMAVAIAEREPLIVVTPHPEKLNAILQERIPTRLLSNIRVYEIPSDDTWARDHGFLTLLTPDGPCLMDFCFNGWGKKFGAEKDNRINGCLWQKEIFRGTYQSHLDFVLEGGSIESDGRGTLMTTRHCLMAPNRNQPMTREQIEEYLLRAFHARKVLWLEHGYLAGDDTDSHIDTLARFCPDDTIAYVRCTDRDDEHYEQLALMEEDLKHFRTPEDKPYRMIPLPMAAPAYGPEGERLPATYANFLIMNRAVLMPTYGTPDKDQEARRQLQKAFPRHEIVEVDCRTLIRQHGSLHCCTMQFPVGALKTR